MTAVILVLLLRSEPLANWQIILESILFMFLVETILLVVLVLVVQFVLIVIFMLKLVF